MIRRGETLMFLGLWLALMVAGRGRLFSDPGTFWHTVVGQRILSSGQLIETDPFTFTHAGKPWIAQQWLGECLMALAHEVGGLDALLLATATVIGGTYAWAYGRLLGRGMHAGLAVLVVVLAIAASAYHFHPRPQLLNVLFLGLTLGWLSDHEAGRCSVYRLFWLVPLYVLWTNIHGGMLGGVATVIMAVAGWVAWRLLGRVSPLQSLWSLVPLGMLALACGLTAFVNPYGTRMHEVWFSLMGSPVLSELISEHAPLLAPKNHAGGWFVLVFGAVYVIVLLGVLPTWPRVTWLIPLAWLALSWTRIRYGPLFAMTAVIAVAEMWPHVRWARWLAEHGSRLMRVQAHQADRETRSQEDRASAPCLLVSLSPGLVVLTTLVLQWLSAPLPVVGRHWVKLDSSRWPVELLPELQEYERTHPEGTPIFNDMYFGGFLIYYTPGLKLFIDDRCELYGDDQLLEYVRTREHESSRIDRWADEHGFEIALTEPGSGFDLYLRAAPHWKVVQQTRAATLYRRVPPP